MNSRTRSPHEPAPSGYGRTRQVEQAEQLGWSDAPPQLRLALGLSVLGAVFLIAGTALGVVQDSPDKGFASTALLALLAVAPPLTAVALTQFGRALTGAGVLTGAALLAPGRAIVDLQFMQDGLLVSRPELLVPTSLAQLTPGTGLWLLLGGHLATAGAGVLAAGRARAAPGSAYGLEVDAGPTSVNARSRAMGWALALATVAAVGLVMPPFRSNNAFLLGHDLIDSPNLVRVGLVLVVAAVLAGCAFAAGSARPAVARGVIVGVLAATAAVSLPAIVAGLAVDRLSPGPGPYLALIALTLLTIVIFVLRGVAGGDPSAGDDTELELEAGRVHLVTGVLGVLAGVAALVGAFGPQLAVDGLDEPVTYANRLLIPVGLLVCLLGATLLTNRWAATVRPAFVVSLGSVVLAGSATLDAAFTGSGISDSIHIGAGAWFAAAAVVIAAAAAVSAAVAGGAERDDVDLTERTVHMSVAAPVAAAILFSVGAFGFPMVTSPDFVAPGIWSEFRLTSWGLVIAMLVVIAAGVISTMARPARAAALLLGAAAVVGIHALELPLTGGRTTDAEAGSGTWLAMACCLAFLVAAGVALAGPAPAMTEPEPEPVEKPAEKPAETIKRPVGKRARGGRA
ncbi:MAG: hypothetical protein GEV28_31995 [Actinophytocola sp.]|uniref:hypothetical protein n=1 Tax=Actinophytocola sp. TaxID=1872138 RepID=UPI001322C9D6|nr:hypothetical protein [Actinophytocola sp.]MPZ84758.1 hypothetical protein [Actinophytocola sp.]